MLIFTDIFYLVQILLDFLIFYMKITGMKLNRNLKIMNGSLMNLLDITYLLKAVDFLKEQMFIKNLKNIKVIKLK